MNDYLIKKRLNELLGKKKSFDNKINQLLFEEYTKDRLQNIPPEQSDARTLLILGNRGLISFVLKKSFGLTGDYNNFEEFAEGKLGLIQAVDEYNSERGTQFVTYAYAVIAHRVCEYYRTLNTTRCRIEKEKVSLNQYISNEGKDASDFCLEDVLMADDDFIRDFEECDLLQCIKKNTIYLSNIELYCTVSFFGLFESPRICQVEIARKLGISQPEVSRSIKRAVNKLKVLSLDEMSLNEQELKFKKILIKQGPKNDFFKSSSEFMI